MMRSVGLVSTIASVLAYAAEIAAMPIIETGAPHTHMKGYGSSGNGSEPVAGGGIRERERRLRQMQKRKGSTP